MAEYAEARRALDRLHRKLMDLNPSAARSLAEGLEETLTVHKLRVPASLRKTLASTNVIESAFSIVEMICRNVKRWRGGDHLERWVGSALLVGREKVSPRPRLPADPATVGGPHRPTFKERSCQRCRSCLTYENRSRYFQRESGTISGCEISFLPNVKPGDHAHPL